MKIAIIGAGFTGLSAAYELSKLKTNEIVVFEKDESAGGLALGYRQKEWKWSLEKYYHHWFTNDYAILNLAKEINHQVIVKRPKTSILIENKIYQLDSPVSVIKFPLLTIFERLRMGMVIGFLKYNPFWKLLEKYRTTEFLKNTMGTKAFELIWKPQLVNKFGKFYNNISLAWFWARIVKRTPSLVYPSGGFLRFAENLVNKTKVNGAAFMFDTEVLEITQKENLLIKYKTSDGKIISKSFDKIIFTLSAEALIKIAKNIQKEYKDTLLELKSLGATNMVLRFNQPFLKDGTYWLSICSENSPVMAVVEHTNFMDKENYNNEHLVYLGNYTSVDNKNFSLGKEEILKLFDGFLNKINPDYKDNLIGYELFKAPFAQPIIPPNYSKILPSSETPIKNLYLANIQQVYPWDRGTNYAVELGQKIARIVTQD